MRNKIMTIEERLEALEAMAHPKPTGKTQKRNDDRLDALKREVAELKRDLSKLQNAITGLPDIGDKVQKRLWW